ncbi:MAG: hypothetical protein ACE5FY_00635 [Nitrospiria bacterium]
MRRSNRHLPILFGCFLVASLFFVPKTTLSEETPSVMFMIAEKNIGQEVFIFWWDIYGHEVDFLAKEFDLSVAETVLKEEFINEGFNVIDISQVSDKIKVSKAYKIADLTKDAAIELGKNVGADVVVKGKVIAKSGTRNSGGNVGSYLADMTVTAFRVHDGLVLGAGRGHGVSRHISEVTGGSQAIERASKKVAEKLVTQIRNKINQ